MVDITIVTGAYKPTYNWGAPHCKYTYISCCFFPFWDFFCITLDKSSVKIFSPTVMALGDNH